MDIELLGVAVKRPDYDFVTAYIDTATAMIEKRSFGKSKIVTCQLPFNDIDEAARVFYEKEAELAEFTPELEKKIGLLLHYRQSPTPNNRNPAHIVLYNERKLVYPEHMNKLTLVDAFKTRFSTAGALAWYSNVNLYDRPRNRWDKFIKHLEKLKG